MQFSFGSERFRPHYVKAFGAEGAGENFETTKKSGGLHPGGLQNLGQPIWELEVHIPGGLISGGLHPGGLQNLGQPIWEQSMHLPVPKEKIYRTLKRKRCLGKNLDRN